MVAVSMAFHSQIGSGSAYPALDGVSFVLNEKCRPPPKVTMPIKFEAGNPSEFIFFEYDTSLELSVIRRCQAEREAMMLAHSRREHENSAVAFAAVSSVSKPIDSSMPKSGDHDANQSTTMEQRADAMYQMINGSSMLLPTPISTSSAVAIGHVMYTAGAPNFVDLKDFESEQDPFENLSLRVMNDREELNKVFRMTADRQTIEPQEESDRSSVRQTTAVNNTHTPSSIDGRSSALLQYVNGNSEMASTCSISFVPCQPIVKQVGVPYQAPLNHLSYTGQPTLPSSSLYHQSSSVAGSNGGYVPIAIADMSLPAAVPTASNTLLRSAKSTPDITSIGETYSVNLARRTPPPTKPPVLQNTESNPNDYWCPAGAPLFHASRTPSSSVASSSKPVATTKSDLYLSLSREGQHFVDTIRGMGFHEIDVSRAVHELGVDDKQVLDHLCLLGQLCEKGCVAADAAAALFLFDNNLEKAESYLKLFKNFSELGFSGDRIKDVLITSNLDEEKSLDLLISTS